MTSGDRGAVWLWAAVAAASICLLLAACGSSDAGSKSGAKSTSDLLEPGTVTGSGYTLTTSYLPPGQELRGDGDADPRYDPDGNGDVDAAKVGGADSDDDNPTVESYKFPDKDDAASFAYGVRPTALEEREITNVIERYYAAVQAENGAPACALLAPSLAHSVVQGFGGSSGGPAYLRGAKTCAGLLSRLFVHYRHEYLGEDLGGPTIVRVGVRGGTAQAIIGSKTMPASIVYLEPTRSGWRIEDLTARQLP